VEFFLFPQFWQYPPAFGFIAFIGTNIPEEGLMLSP